MKPPKTLAPQQRENPEPTESSLAVPWWMSVLVGLLVAFGVVYIAISDANTPSALGDGRTAEDFAQQPVDSAQGANGEALYAAMCAACHQAAGQGLPGVFPPLAGSEWVLGEAPVATAIVLHGLMGPITVKGQTYNGAMPAFGGQLDDVQLAALLTHLRTSWGNSASPVSADAVAQVRAQLKDRTTPFEGEQALKGLP